jgi:hypothetical protein
MKGGLPEPYQKVTELIIKAAAHIPQPCQVGKEVGKDLVLVFEYHLERR